MIVFGVALTGCKNKKSAVTEQPKVDSSLSIKYADLLQVPSDSIKNNTLYKFIDDWYGVKYQFGGQTKDGVDCSGFCNVLFKEVYKKQLPRTTKEIAKTIKKVNKENLTEGNLVFFNIKGKKNAHVGVYLQNQKFVHASTSKGVLISSLNNPYYIKAYNKGGLLQ